MTTDISNNITWVLTNRMRLPSNERLYWQHQLQEFSNQFASMQVKRVEFGRQDLRGVPSITLVDFNLCVPKQLHFPSAKELLQFVRGYNLARSKHNDFIAYSKLA